MQQIIQAQDSGLDIHIFIKKDNDEGTDFYYMGQATPIKESVSKSTMANSAGKKLPVVRMHLKLHHQIDKTLYQYLTGN